MITEEQRKDRINSIGSSDAAAVIGLSRWKSPLDVWAEKTGLIVPDDISGKLSVELGNELEDFVARKFMKESGKKVQRVNETVVHPKYQFLTANLDRRVVGEKSILEAKTASVRRSKEFEGDEIPADYVIQVMHQLAVSGANRGYLAILIGNEDFKIKTIERDEDALKNLVAREVAFWKDFVETKIMPSVTGRDRDTLSDLFPEATEGKEVFLGEEAVVMCEILEGMEEDLKALTSQVDKQKNEIRVLLGDAEVGRAGDWEIKWANVKTKRLDMKRIQDEAPELMDKFYKLTTTRRFVYSKMQDQQKEK